MFHKVSFFVLMKPSSFTIFPPFFSSFFTHQTPSPGLFLRLPRQIFAALPPQLGLVVEAPVDLARLRRGWIHPNNVEVFARKNVEKM